MAHFKSIWKITHFIMVGTIILYPDVYHYDYYFTSHFSCADINGFVSVTKYLIYRASVLYYLNIFKILVTSVFCNILVVIAHFYKIKKYCRRYFVFIYFRYTYGFSVSDKSVLFLPNKAFSRLRSNRRVSFWTSTSLIVTNVRISNIIGWLKSWILITN